MLHRRLPRAGAARARERGARDVTVTYKGAGVDVGRAEDAVARVRERIKRTKRPEVIGDVGQFGGLFASPGADTGLVAATDGVGTKLELARLLDRHEVVGADLVHHCVNDALAMGAEPLFFLDYFATSRLEPPIFERVVGAMADACARCGVALLGGETAEMPGMYAPGTYDVAGFLVGAVSRAKVLGPARVREGDALSGIPSSALHTNGFSPARAISPRVAALDGQSIANVLSRHDPVAMAPRVSRVVGLRCPRPGQRDDPPSDPQCMRSGPGWRSRRGRRARRVRRVQPRRRRGARAGRACGGGPRPVHHRGARITRGRAGG